jgi:hypothetical protein
MTKVGTAPIDGFWIMENSSLTVRIEETRAWFEVTDKRTGMTWGHDPWYDTVGELTVHNVATGTTHTCHLSDAEQKTITPLDGSEPGFALRFERIVDNTPDRVLLDSVTLECQLVLPESGAELVARAVSMEDPIEEWSLIKLTFPCRLGWFKALDDAYLVVPWHMGVLIPGHVEGYRPVYEGPGQWNDVRVSLDYSAFIMPMFGVVREAGSMLAILDTPFDAFIEVMGNYNLGGRQLETTRARLSSCYPGWRPSKGSLRRPRTVRYQFFPDGDYVDLAKAYRADAISKGKFRSLTDKARQTPAVERLYGAPCLVFYNVWNFDLAPDRPPVHSGELYDGYHEALDDFEGTLRCLRICHDELGMDRAQVYAYGINEGGPDVRYPDIFPINQKAGGEQKFRELCEYMADVGYVGPMADTYIHTYVDSPSFDPKNLVLQDGRLRRYMRRPLEGGSPVRGEGRPLKQWAGGTEHTHCGPVMSQFARRNYPQLLEIAPISGTYLDVITALSLNECYDPNHPMTRSDDAFWRHKLLDYMRSLGIVVDSEMPQEFALLSLDASHFWDVPPVGVPVPLWQLVYHDALVCKHFVGPIVGWGPVSAGYSAGFLRALVCGDSIQVLILEEFLHDPGYRKWLAKQASVVRQLHGEVASGEMLAHEFLTDDYGVQRARFESGAVVTVNFRVIGFEMADGGYLPAHGYSVRLGSGDIVEGSLWPV